MTDQFNTSFSSFLDKWQERIDTYYEKDFKSLKVPYLTFTIGKKYLKVISDNSVRAFVNMATGDVLKAAGWNAPAKHARGNIFSINNGMDAIDCKGHVIYLN